MVCIFVQTVIYISLLWHDLQAGTGLAKLTNLIQALLTVTEKFNNFGYLYEQSCLMHQYLLLLLVLWYCQDDIIIQTWLDSYSYSCVTS